MTEKKENLVEEIKEEKAKEEKPKEEKENIAEEREEFNIKDHFLVPKHEVMTKKELDDLLKKFDITTKQFPRILHSDPIVKEIGAKIGDVLRITRKSQVAEKSFYYRIVSK